MRKSNPIFCYVIVIVFLIVGFSTFFTGCSKLEGTCFNYVYMKMNVIDYKITNSTCKSCIDRGTNNQCEKYSNYECYFGYVTVINSNNFTCNVEVISKSKTLITVEKLESEYEINEEIEILKKKGSTSCIEYTFDDEANTYIGIVFFILSFLLIFLNCYCFSLPNKNKISNYDEENKSDVNNTNQYNYRSQQGQNDFLSKFYNILNKINIFKNFQNFTHSNCNSTTIRIIPVEIYPNNQLPIQQIILCNDVILYNDTILYNDMVLYNDTNRYNNIINNDDIIKNQNKNNFNDIQVAIPYNPISNNDITFFTNCKPCIV